MTDGFYHKKNDGADRDSMGRLYFGGVSVRFGLDNPGKDGELDCSVNWKKYLVRELLKVSGGMDGLTMTDHGYTNQPDVVPEGKA